MNYFGKCDNMSQVVTNRRHANTSPQHQQPLARPSTMTVTHPRHDDHGWSSRRMSTSTTTTTTTIMSNHGHLPPRPRPRPSAMLATPTASTHTGHVRPPPLPPLPWHTRTTRRAVDSSEGSRDSSVSRAPQVCLFFIF
jgi:hypothetical protein